MAKALKTAGELEHLVLTELRNRLLLGPVSANSGGMNGKVDEKLEGEPSR